MQRTQKKKSPFFFVVVKRHTPTNTHIHVINHKNNENTVIIATHPCSCYVTYGPGSSLFFFFIVAVPSIEYPWHGHTHLHHYTMYCISRVLRVYWYVMIWFIIWMCVLCGRSSGNLLFSWLLPLASPTFSIENKSYRFLCSIPTHTHTPLKSTIFVIIIAAFHHKKK